MECCEQGCAYPRKSNICRMPGILKNVQPDPTLQFVSERRRQSYVTPVSAKAAFIDAYVTVSALGADALEKMPQMLCALNDTGKRHERHCSTCSAFTHARLEH